MSLRFENLASASRERISTRSLLEYANQNRNEGFFNDVNIKVANECFPANRMVLSCFSCVFEQMFKVEMKERYEETVEVKAVDEKSMKILIDYIYIGYIDIDNENVMNLLAAADYLQLEDVKKYCFEFLISILSPETWFAIFSASVLYNNEYFKHHLHQYLSRNFDEISLSADFKTLSKKALATFVGNLDRNEVEETSVYQALITWTKFGEDNRKTELPNLLQSVKFENISEKFCGEIISQEDLITNNHQCMKVVFQGFSQKLNVISKRDEKFTLICLSKNQSFELLILNLYKQEMKNTNIPDLPISLEDFHLLPLNDVVFCIGEESGNISSRRVFQIELKKDKKWHEIANPNEVARKSSAAVFKDTLVVGGGYKKGSSENIPWVDMYFPTMNEWKKIAPMKIARRNFELVNCEGCLYAIGGYGNNNRTLSSVERLMDFDRKWEYVKSTITPRQNHTAVSYKGCIYVFGGEINNVRLKSVEKYNPTVNEWCYVSDMNCKISELAACVINEKIYIVGGIAATENVRKTIQCYDPRDDFWSTVGKIHSKLQGHSLLAI